MKVCWRLYDVGFEFRLWGSGSDLRKVLKPSTVGFLTASVGDYKLKPVSLPNSRYIVNLLITRLLNSGSP